MVYPHIEYCGPAYPSEPRAKGPAIPRELDRRISDGLDVRLLWHPGSGKVSVSVHDAKTGDAFELPVRDGERALDVYHHPYAFATDMV
jgi:hypothetical protein